MWERCVSFASELDRRLFSGWGGLEAGSDCQLGLRRARLLAPRGLPSPAIPGHPLGCLVAGGEPGQPGDNIRYRLWTFFPGAAGTKGSLRSASADNLSEDVLSAL